MEENRENPQTQSTRVLLPAVAVITVAVLGYMVARPSLESARPEGSQKDLIPAPPSAQGFPAKFSRLWEDPFEATGGILHDPADQQSRSQIDKDANGVDDNVPRALDYIVQSGGQETSSLHIVAVLLPGGPYADDRERRMRIRYAALSALGASGYRLALPKRMSYIVTPFVSYIRALNEFRQVPLIVPLKLYSSDDASRESSGQEGGSLERVLVLWLNETQLGDMPLNAAGQILEKMFPLKETQSKLKVSIVGPTSSDMLLSMSREQISEDAVGISLKEKSFVKKITREYLQERFQTFTVYSPRATIASEDLTAAGATELRELTDPTFAMSKSGETDPSKHREDSLTVIRTVGTDRHLVNALASELKLRNAFPRDLLDKRHVVVITERDTLYGRALRSAFSFDEGKESGVPKTKLHVFTYLRGLDGELPKGESDKNGEKDSEKNGSKEERPVGRSQLDYLRRMAQQIEQLQQRLTNTGDGEITAIGVMGTDIYDKLLVLRALRSQFPRAWFFTTDLDSALFHADERPHTRNVIVASHFGLELHPGLQRDAPKFRDSYQTALYFSMLMVLGDKKIDDIYSGEAKAARLDPWRTQAASQEQELDYFLKPLVFEISRHGPYQLTSTGAPHSERKWQRLVAERGDRDSVTALVQPASPREVAARRAPKRWFLALLALLLLWATVAAYHNKCREMTSRVIRSFAQMIHPWKATPSEWVVVLGFFILAFFIGLVFWDAYLSSSGEPWEWTAGISVWPSSLIRLVAFVLAVVLVKKGYKDLKKTELELAETFALGLPTKKSKSNARVSFKRRWRKLRSRFRFPVSLFQLWFSLLPKGRPADTRRHPKKKWTWYLQRSYWKARALRAIPAGTLFLLSGIIVLKLWGSPFQPSRGWFSTIATAAVLGVAVFATLVLLFFVLDAIQLCRGLVMILTKERSQWTNAADILGNRGSSYPDDIARELLDIRFTAELTHTVGKLVLYPFFILFLMIISRIKVFDNWDVPWSLLAIFTAMFASIIWATLALRNTSEKGRQQVLARLRNGLARETGEGNSTRVAQYELAISEVKSERRGSYRPLIEDPIVRAVVIPFGGIGGVVLIEQLARVV